MKFQSLFRTLLVADLIVAGLEFLAGETLRQTMPVELIEYLNSQHEAIPLGAWAIFIFLVAPIYI